MLTPLRDLLNRPLNQLGLKRSVDAVIVCKKFDQLLADTLPDLASHCRSVSFSGGRLKVLADSTAAANELHLHRQQLLDRLAGQVTDLWITTRA